MRPFAAIVLAAGASSRFGAPKQNALLEGKSLLLHAIEAGRRLKPELLVVVQGAVTLGVPPDVLLVTNENWDEGLSSSIRVGVRAIDLIVSSCLLMLCDQPLVPPSHLDALVQAIESESDLSATQYPDGTAGVPAAFGKDWFNELTHLTGEKGAKSLLKSNRVRSRLFPLDAWQDVDTAQDLQRVSKLRSGS